jgi:hypothetical protein
MTERTNVVGLDSCQHHARSYQGLNVEAVASVSLLDRANAGLLAKVRLW